METTSVCRCCLAPGLHKDINSSYTWLDRKEIYSEMLRDCFNIVLSSIENNAICDECVKIIRSSCEFKQQVLRCDQELASRALQLCDNEEKPFEIKLEPKQDSGDESDDYFLLDTVRQMSMEKVKLEKKPKKECKRHKPLKKTADWRTEKIKLVTRLTTIDSRDNKKAVKVVKTRQITLKKSDPGVSWTRRCRDKHKHKENLLTVLQCSNAVPFQNKSLLGFLCAYCRTPFPDPADLRDHTNTLHASERLNFKSNFDMTEFNVKLDVTDLTCSLCDAKLNHLAALKEHLTKNHAKMIHEDIKDHMQQFKLKKGDVYDCAMCPSTYETFKMLKQHMNKHYSNYSCSKCESSFATQRSLNAHKTVHIEGSFKCDHCEKVFQSRPKKLYHEKMKHMGTRNISNCPFCDEPFRSYYQRNQHLIKVHNAEAQYKCNVCDKSYILKSLLMYHIKKSHLMERNYQCTECGYRFFSKKALKAHMVKHTGERIYACDVCHKSYARKYTLREHMRIHNNDRRFKCEVCGMSFVQKCSLKSHLLSNHGISMAASAITSSL